MINEMLPARPTTDTIILGDARCDPLNIGFTKYEEVLLRFMVSTHSTCMETMTPADVAKAAHNFTIAYFAQVQQYTQEQSEKTNDNGK